MEGASTAPPLPETDWAAVPVDNEQLAITRNAVCRKHKIFMGQLLERAAGAEWIKQLAQSGVSPIALVGEAMTEALR